MTLTEKLRRLKTDHEIHKDVRAELELNLDITDQDNVDITVDAGVVTLDGYADSYAQKWAIEHAASGVHGVKSVLSYLEVAPSKDDDRTDDEIEAAAKRALEWDARVPYGVDLEVKNHVVRLRGIVGRLSEGAAAESAVRNLLGVRGVTSDIHVAATEQVLDIKAVVEAAVRRRLDDEATNVSVAVDGGVVRLSGKVPSVAARDDVERAATLALGVTRVDDQIQIV